MADASCVRDSFVEPGTSALLIAHPGHELRVHKWFCDAKPVTVVLTTGSRSGSSLARARATADLATRAGAKRSALFCSVLDRDFYTTVLDGDTTTFESWINLMRKDLVGASVRRIVVDAWQGYSVAHDLMHVMGRLAAIRASDLLGWQIEVEQFLPVPISQGSIQGLGPCQYTLRLSEADVNAKRLAIQAHPGVQTEVEETFHFEGAETLERESFFAPVSLEAVLSIANEKLAYERYGEERVAEGRYRQVIRRSHVDQIVSRLLDHTPVQAAS